LANGAGLAAVQLRPSAGELDHGCDEGGSRRCSVSVIGDLRRLEAELEREIALQYW
jgi:hypothetical protein